MTNLIDSTFASLQEILARHRMEARPSTIAIEDNRTVLLDRSTLEPEPGTLQAPSGRSFGTALHLFLSPTR